MYYLFLLFLG